MYSLEQVKAAFFGAFYKSGELWFDYLDIQGRDDEAAWAESTDEHWQSFVDTLQELESTEKADNTESDEIASLIKLLHSDYQPSHCFTRDEVLAWLRQLSPVS